MNFRALLAAVTLLSAGVSSAQTPCDPDTLQPSCNADGTILVCDAETNPAAPVEASLACTDIFGQGAADAACGTPGCVGACTGQGPGCLAAVGEKCIGFGPLFNRDANDDRLVGGVNCEGDATCAVTVENQQPVDRCVDRIGPACTADASASCAGDVWTICLGDQAGTFSLTSNIALDCALVGTTCGEQPCACDAQCGENGTCTNGVCEGGVTCIADAADLPECPVGEGEGEGEGEADGNNNRDDQAEPAPSGGCELNAFGAAMPALGSLAALVLALRRRRR